MAPLATVDALDDDLIRRRFRLAAAAEAWLVTRDPFGPADAPRTLLQPDGPVTLWRTPRRAHAARTLVELDTLLALGVVPASVGRAGPGDAPWRAVAREADIEVVDVAAGDGLARLLAAGVDLVVVSDALAAGAPEELAGYRSLGVPVVRIPDGDVVGQLRRVGTALDLVERAANLAAGVQDRLDAFSAPAASIMVCTDRGDGQVYVSTAASAVGRLLRTLGRPDPVHPAGTGDAVAVARSGLADLGADLVIGLETRGGALAELESDPRFAALPAVRAGGYRRFDPTSSYALAVPSVLTIGIALDALGSALAG